MATANRSAGLALIRGDGAAREVLLVHPGGPFWAKKNEGAWSLPKGLLDPGEEPLEAAKREFFEEVGHPAPVGPCVALGEVTLKSGKKVIAFAVRGELDAATIRSNEIDVEFPPRSGRIIRIPEVDRAEWATLDRAKQLLNPAQVPLIEAAMRAVL
ncbi:MAG: NUDIX domain-containing protein [Archangium sp.]|nr:NUDIX domain-containing protein [Archangium sp.]